MNRGGELFRAELVHDSGTKVRGFRIEAAGGEMPVVQHSRFRVQIRGNRDRAVGRADETVVGLPIADMLERMSFFSGSLRDHRFLNRGKISEIVKLIRIGDAENAPAFRHVVDGEPHPQRPGQGLVVGDERQVIVVTQYHLVMRQILHHRKDGPAFPADKGNGSPCWRNRGGRSAQCRTTVRTA